jgi:hypothetical protein
LARDTIETVQVLVTDDSQIVDDLSGSTPKFDVTESDNTTAVETAENATAVDMIVYCLLDTTAWSALEDEFHLWIYFTVGSETPRLGPFVIELT